MPSVLRIRGFRFYAYALEGNEPAHVYIDRGSGQTKVWLGDLSVASSQGLKPAEIRAALRLSREHRAILLNAWHAWETRKSQGRQAGDHQLTLWLDDARIASAPLSCYTSLVEASPAERKIWQPSGASHGIHWPALDYDLSVENILEGRKEHPNALSYTRETRATSSSTRESARRPKAVRKLVAARMPREFNEPQPMVPFAPSRLARRDGLRVLGGR